MRILNLSAEPLGKLRAWLPHDLRAEHVVFLPDACPGKAPLPTGTAVLTRQPDWRRFAVSDCGCGMRLLRSRLGRSDLTPAAWDAVADALRRGDLKYVQQSDGADRLYDLAVDPSEQADLARKRAGDLATLKSTWESVNAQLLPY